jgi:hypothetical protein
MSKQTHCASCGREFKDMCYWHGCVENGMFCESCRKKWVKFASERGLQFSSPHDAAIIGFNWDKRNEPTAINKQVKKLWNEFVHSDGAKEIVEFT